MQFVLYALYFVHVIVSIFLILVVLLQQGKGADLAVFGGGSTQAAFGSRSATTVLHKLTVGGFVLFIVTTLTIAILQAREHDFDSVVGGTAGTAAGVVLGEEPAEDPEAQMDEAPDPDAPDEMSTPVEPSGEEPATDSTPATGDEDGDGDPPSDDDQG
jgi:preprotein translocase subunit SecG